MIGKISKSDIGRWVLRDRGTPIETTARIINVIGPNIYIETKGSHIICTRAEQLDWKDDV